MENWKADRIAAALLGENPMVLARMKSGFAVLGDTQFLRGYCVLLGVPKADSLNERTLPQRADFLLDMSLIGDAIMEICAPLRINYDILGNTDSYLHAHIFPRYASEPEELRKMPPWHYPKACWTDLKFQYNPLAHEEMKKALTTALLRQMEKAYEKIVQ